MIFFTILKPCLKRNKKNAKQGNHIFHLFEGLVHFPGFPGSTGSMGSPGSRGPLGSLGSTGSTAKMGCKAWRAIHGGQGEWPITYLKLMTELSSQALTSWRTFEKLLDSEGLETIWWNIRSKRCNQWRYQKRDASENLKVWRIYTTIWNILESYIRI